MTKRNTNLKSEPFLLKPAGKDYLWGGNRLNDDFSKGIPMSPLAETWECSTHPDGPSSIASGWYAGRLLSDVLKEHPEFMGTHPRTRGELPILLKLIDAKQDLSIQVHPDDEYAFQYENQQQGKTEMWYVLDAAKDASLIYGFHHDMDSCVLREALKKGDIEKYLQKVPVHRDDVFFIEPGTVHAIGAGVLIAEIQQNSNITYRMYDYNRRDRHGNMRALHVEKALSVANMKGSPRPRQPMRILRYRPGCATEFLCRCKYFQVERMLINTENCRELADFKTDSNSFQVFLCVGGCGVLLVENGEPLHFFKGDCVFIPADSESIKIHGSAQLLKVTC